MSKTVLVMIGHRKRSGKDVFAGLLKDKLAEYKLKTEIISFGEPIKIAVSKARGISLEELNELKDTTDSEVRNDIDNFSMYMKESNPDIWINIVKENINKLISDNVDVIVITDFRLLEEFKKLSEFEPVTIKIAREFPESDLTTETQLDEYPYDITIDNGLDRTLDDLKEASEEVAGLVETLLVNKHIQADDKDWLVSRYK